MNTKDSDSVAVFWDYENCPAPSNTSGYSIAHNICALARPFGVVKLFKAYLEISGQGRPHPLRSELQSSGVSLVDCPHNGRKEVADKMLMVDLLAFAIDNPAPTTIILITGDRDFAYALSILKHRLYKVVLVTLPNAHASLTLQASICLDWFDDVINRSDDGVQYTQTLEHKRSLASRLTDDIPLGEEEKKSGLLLKDTSTTGSLRITTSPSRKSRNASTIWASSPDSSPPIHKEVECDHYSPQSSTQRQKGRSPDENSGRPPLLERFESPDRSPPLSPSSDVPSSPLSISSRRTESDTELDRPLIVPSIYVYLVMVLQRHRREGIIHSYRSVIARKMSSEQETYRRARVDTFAEFMDLAEKDGIIELGGSPKCAWVRLRSDWHNAVSY